MKRFEPVTLRLLLLTVLLPATAFGQIDEQAIGSIMAPSMEVDRVDQSARLFPTFSFGEPAAVARPAQAGAARRPASEGSMTGYVENAIIGSQFRIRFDAGFGNPTPDMAEFFYAKCGCYAFLGEAAPVAFDPNTPGPGPGVASSVDFQQLYFNAEYAPSPRFSIFAEIPVRWIEAQSFAPTPLPDWADTDHAGLSDIRLGFKAGLVASEDSHVTFQFRATLPSGDASMGLGTDNTRIEPAILFNQRMGTRGIFEGQFGFSVPSGGSVGILVDEGEDFAGDLFFYGFGPSYEVYSDNQVRIAPVIEFVGWRILNGFVSENGSVLGLGSPADGANILNVKVGVRTAFGLRNSLYIGYGKALTDRVWYDDILRIEHRISF